MCTRLCCTCVYTKVRDVLGEAAFVFTSAIQRQYNSVLAYCAEYTMLGAYATPWLYSCSMITQSHSSDIVIPAQCVCFVCFY